jgi:hypothetical protein
MRRAVTIFFFILLTIGAHGQEKVIYHEYSETASSWDIIRWNLTDTTNVIWKVKEIDDEKGRVKELDFLKNGALVDDYLCYLANRVTYEYKKQEIIERFFHEDQELLATECEMPFKKIYHLDNQNFITKTEVFAKYDFAGMDSSQIKQWKEWVSAYKVEIPDSEPLEVDYYEYSFAKMNGIYPVSRNFKLTEDGYYGDEPEKSGIKKGIEKLKNSR